MLGTLRKAGLPGRGSRPAGSGLRSGARSPRRGALHRPLWGLRLRPPLSAPGWRRLVVPTAVKDEARGREGVPPARRAVPCGAHGAGLVPEGRYFFSREMTDFSFCVARLTPAGLFTSILSSSCAAPIREKTGWKFHQSSFQPLPLKQRYPLAETAAVKCFTSDLSSCLMRVLVGLQLSAASLLHGGCAGSCHSLKSLLVPAFAGELCYNWFLFWFFLFDHK